MKLLDRFTEKSFWDSTKIVKDKEVVQLVRTLLSNNNIDIKPEVVLSAYIIHLYPSDVLSSDRSVLENFILTKSTNIVNIIENEENNRLVDNTDEFISYSNAFDDWKNKDAKSQLDIYLDMYVSYKNMQDVDCDEKNDLLDKLYKSINLLSNNTADTLIQQLESSLQNNLRDNAILIHHQIEKQMKNAYWDNIIQNGIDNNVIIGWLVDVKQMFLDIYSHYRYSSGEITLINEYLDIDFIKPQIEITHDFDINKLLHWICDKAKSLDAASFDNEYIQIHRFIDEENTSSYVKSVRFIFERLEDINNFSVNTN